MERSSSYSLWLQTQKRSQPLWVWKAKPGFNGVEMEPSKCSEAICYSRTFWALSRGQRGPWEAGAGSLYRRKPLPAKASCFKHVSSLHLLPVSPKSGREGAFCGKQELALLVSAGPSFTAQVLPPFTGEACVPKASRSPREETGRSPAVPSACTPSGEGENHSTLSVWEEACTNTQQAALLWALTTAQPRHGLLHPLMSLCKLPLHKGPCLPSTNSKHAQLHLHQAEQLLLPGSRNVPAQVLHLPPTPSQGHSQFKHSGAFPKHHVDKVLVRDGLANSSGHLGDHLLQL